MEDILLDFFILDDDDEDGRLYLLFLFRVFLWDNMLIIYLLELKRVSDIYRYVR